MKKIFTMVTAIILATGISAFAAGNGSAKQVSQKTNYQLSFEKLVVSNDIDIMLVEDQEKSLEFTGTDADIAQVDWKIKDGVLSIKSKGKSLKGKVKITVNVSHLKELFIKGDSQVRSAGELASANLRIHLDGDCFISVRNKGCINIVSDAGTELDIKRVTGDVIFG